MLDLELELGAIQQPFQLDTIKRAREEEPMKFFPEFFPADV